MFTSWMDTVMVGTDGGIEVDSDAALFSRLYPSLRRFAAVTAGPDDDPDDLVQEAVARTLRRRSLGSLEHPGAYLRQAIVHLVINTKRTHARWQVAAARLRPDAEGRDPEYASDLADLYQLHPASRALLFLVEVEGRSYAEAAALLETTEEAARTRAARARRQLRLQLIEESE